MGLVILFVCLGAALNLALWAALWRKMDDLPAAFLALARRERAEAETRALTVLQEMAAARVAAITLSLQSLEEQHIERNRSERAEAEVRARVAERRAAEVVPTLGVATELVRELRASVDRLGELPAVLQELQEARAAARAAAELVAARPTVPANADDDACATLETLPPLPSAPSPAEADGDDDDRTVVAARPAILPPRAGGAVGEGTVARGDGA